MDNKPVKNKDHTMTFHRQIVKIVVTVALLASAIGLGFSTWHEIRFLQNSMVRFNAAAAKLTAEHCVTAVSFNYSDKAEEILLSLLKQEDAIREAYIFDKQGGIFAAVSNKKDINAPSVESGHTFTGNILISWVPIEYHNQRYGTVLIKTKTGFLDKVLSIFGISFGMLAILVLLAYLLGSRLAVGISRSIEQIVDVTDRASREDDYKQVVNCGKRILELERLSESLNHLFSRLRRNQRDEHLRRYQQQGALRLGENIRQDLPMDEFCDGVLSFVTQYVGAQVGALYYRQEERLELIAGFAFKRRRTNDNLFHMGEGMVGQVAREKKSILFENVPPDHLNLMLDSGLAETIPAYILVLPLLHEKQVMGVMELASSTSFGHKEMTFLEESARGIALAIYAVQSRIRTEELLVETRRQAQELQDRQKKLEAVNKELEEQASELRRSQQLLQDQRKELQASNIELTERENALNQEREEIYAELARGRENKEMAMIADGDKEIDHRIVPSSAFSTMKNNSRAEPSFVSASNNYGAVSGGILQELNGTKSLTSQHPYSNIQHKTSDIQNRVLIIEDDPDFAMILKKNAIRKGFEALVAKCGREGLLLVEKQHPQALILDLTLPDMDGMEVLRILKANPVTCNIPVHIVSARDRDNTILQQGAIGYLSKPATAEEIDRIFDLFHNLASGGRRAQLLIVEHDPVCRRDTTLLFKGRKVDVTTACSAKEALLMLSNRNFDVVILDLDLPDMAGFTLFNKLSQKQDFELPPVVIYTDKERAEEEVGRFESKIASVVVKGPDSCERLLDEVSLFLNCVCAGLPEESRLKVDMYHDPEMILAGKKVLVVDDDMRNISALELLLKREGMVVVTASDGRQGLNRLTENPDIKLVLMDIMMPNMDGYEAIEKIRDMAEYEKLPIIALTAKAMREDRDRCLAAGASDYLAKPVDNEKLLSMIRVWIGE